MRARRYILGAARWFVTPPPACDRINLWLCRIAAAAVAALLLTLAFVEMHYVG